MKQLRLLSIFVLVFAVAGLMLPSSGEAVTTTWVGGNYDYSWSASHNWDNGAPATGVDVVIPDNYLGDYPIVDVANAECASLTITTGYLDLGGNSLTCTSVIINNTGSITGNGNLTVNGDITQSAGILRSDLGTVTVNGNVNQSGGTFVGKSGSTIDINGDLTQTSGTFGAFDSNAAPTISIEGDWSTGGTFTKGQSTVTFNGSTNATIKDNNVDFYKWAIDKDSHTDTLSVEVTISYYNTSNAFKLTTGTLEFTGSGSIDFPSAASMFGAQQGTKLLLSENMVSMVSAAELPAATTEVAGGTYLAKAGVNVTNAPISQTIRINGGTFKCDDDNVGDPNQDFYWGDAVEDLTLEISAGSLECDDFYYAGYSVIFLMSGGTLAAQDSTNFGNALSAGSSITGGTINCLGDFLLSNQFDATGGTVVMNGANKTIYNTLSSTLYNLTINDATTSDGDVLDVDGDLEVHESLTSNYAVEVGGDADIDSTFQTTSGGVTVDGTLTVQTGESFTSAAGITANNFTVDGTSVSNGAVNVNDTFTINSGASVNVNGYDVTAGTFNVNEDFSAGGNLSVTNIALAANKTLTVSKSLAISGTATLNNSGSVVTFDGTLASHNVPGVTYYDLNIEGENDKVATGSITVDHNLTIGSSAPALRADASLKMGAYNLHIGGAVRDVGGSMLDVKGDGTLDVGTGTTTVTDVFNVDSGGMVDVNDGKIEFEGAGTDWTLNGTLDATDGHVLFDPSDGVQILTTALTIDTLTVASGDTLKLTATGTPITVTITRNLTGSTVEFGASGNQTIPAWSTNGNCYGNVLISGSGTKSLSGTNTRFEGDLTITGGTLSATANNYDIFLTGDWERTGGDFDEQGGQVHFDGESTLQTAETFYDLELESNARLHCEQPATVDGLVEILEWQNVAGHLTGTMIQNIDGGSAKYFPGVILQTTTGNAGEIQVYFAKETSDMSGGHLAIRRHWNISPYGLDLRSSYQCKATFFYDGDDVTEMNDNEQPIAPFRFNSGTGEWQRYSSYTTRGDTVSIATGITNLDYEWTLANEDNALPVELVNFMAKPVAEGVLLNWRTESEINNLGFYVERSDVSAKEGFVRISELLDGQGTTTIPQNYQYLDDDVKTGGTYYYRLVDVEEYTLAETTHPVIEVYISSVVEIPAAGILTQNFPNPFNPVTTIKFGLPETAPVSIHVYDVSGRLVRTLVNEEKSAGYYTVQWDGMNDQGQALESGVYIYRLESPSFVETRQMILMK